MLLGASLLIGGLIGCERELDERFPTIDPTPVDKGADAGRSDIDEDPEDPEIPDEVSVPLELGEYIGAVDPAEPGAMRVYQLDSADELPSGPMVEARPGDWVMENDRLKVFIEGLDRAMSPCPYGGNIVDAQVKMPDGALSEDNTGEICLMVNVGQTFAPERFDVVRDGADGGAIVLAVSGRLELLDFLDVETMADDYAPGILDGVSIDPNTIIPSEITRYFILKPGDTNVRVVGALKNLSDETQHLVVGHLMRGGGHGHYFNPLSQLKGWGYVSLGLDNLGGEPLPFVAYSGPTGGYAYVPEPVESLRRDPEDLPRGGVQAAISGVSVSLVGRDGLADTLLASKRQLKTMPGLLHLDPGEVGIIDHREYFGGGALSTITDAIYQDFDIDTGALYGRVLGPDGEPVAAVEVTAVNAAGQAISQARTDAEGRYEMIAPVGEYQLRARRGMQISREEVGAALDKDGRAEANLALKDIATIQVKITTPDGAPTPGRVSLLCEEECPDMPTSLEQDITSDRLPGGFSHVTWAGVDGAVELEVAPGKYRVSVSRGVTWSIWPADAPEDGGELLDLAEGDAEVVEAEIAPVVDTTGVLNGDFHVHGITSADSVVRPESRVLGFMGDGVDVLVSSDHDYIYDYAPMVAELDAARQIATLVGVEITTPNIGHFNSFPMRQDLEDRRNGALDWGSDSDNFNATPAEIFAWMDQNKPDTSEAVVKQINHAQGTIPPLKADVLRGISFADAAGRRMEPSTPDPASGDTGLWSDEFNALEIMNGPDMPKFWTIMRWWLTMISRGFSPTGTAVTDTHRLYSDLGGIPRTFVFVDPAHDSAETFDEDVFTTAITEGRAVGSNGPFFRVELANQAGDTAGLGELLESEDDAVTARITVDVPEWLPVDTIDIYSNLDADEIITAPGEVRTEPVPPTSSHAIDWQPEDLKEAFSGEQTHRHRQKTVEIPLTITEDAYIVVVVRAADEEASMWPVAPRQNLKPFAFSNPIFVDRDGGGYDNPPLKALAESAPEPLGIKTRSTSAFKRELTPEDLGRLFEHFTRQDHAASR